MALPRILTKAVGNATALAGGAAGAVGMDRTGARLNNIGNAIIDPNKVYTGTLNPLSSDFKNSNGANWATVNPANAPAPGGAGGGDDGTGGGTNTGGGGVAADPNAAARTSFLDSITGALGNIRQNGLDAFGSGARNLQGAAEGLYNQVSQGQRSVNAARENVELSRLNGVQDILGFVRNGLKSGTARLSNMNALEGSGADALSRAYGEMGSNKMRNVGNEAAMENRNIDVTQEGVDMQSAQGQRDFKRSYDDTVSTIGSQVRQQLAELDTKGKNVGVTGRVAIEAEKQRIIDEGIKQLHGAEAWLNNNMGNVVRQDPATTGRNAVALQQAGTAGATPFDVGDMESAQVAGPAISQLPLFTRQRKVAR